MSRQSEEWAREGASARHCEGEYSRTGIAGEARAARCGTVERPCEEKLREREAQLETCADDPRLAAFRGRQWTRMTLTFVGRREIFYRAPGGPTRRLEPEPEFE